MGELSIDLRVCGDIVVVVFVDHLKRTSLRSKMIPVYDASEWIIGNESCLICQELLQFIQRGGSVKQKNRMPRSK